MKFSFVLCFDSQTMWMTFFIFVFTLSSFESIIMCSGNGTGKHCTVKCLTLLFTLQCTFSPCVYWSLVLYHSALCHKVQNHTPVCSEAEEKLIAAIDNLTRSPSMLKKEKKKDIYIFKQSFLFSRSNNCPSAQMPSGQLYTLLFHANCGRHWLDVLLLTGSNFEVVPAWTVPLHVMW